MSGMSMQARISAEALRFVERSGLLPAPLRNSTSAEPLSPPVLRRLRFIQTAQRLGFAFHEIRDLLAISDARLEGRSPRSVSVQRQVEMIDDRIVALMRLRQALLQMRERPEGHESVASCPILAALQNEADD